METTNHRIESVEEGSLGQEIGLEPGDVLTSINGESFVDFVDYEALCSCENLLLTVIHAGEETEIEVEKEEWESLGLTFEDGLLQTRVCRNHCIFCFVDQNPKGLRDTLYVKDDDWRMSLMMGNFVTLTNVRDEELERIIRRKVSPLYISVHATDPTVRMQMMRNKNAGKILAQLKRLAKGGIQFHCQIVVCPGYNDGKVLEDTIKTLSTLHPSALSVALVPVGLTCFRENLTPLTPFNRSMAQDVVRMVKRLQGRFYRTLGTRFVYASDEFYALSEEKLPGYASYEDFAQIENGVGLLRLFEEDFVSAYEEDKEEHKQVYEEKDQALKKEQTVLLVSGVSAAPYLEEILSLHPIKGLEVIVLPVQNQFFGPSVTVTGLLTGSDLIRELKDVVVDQILIPSNMLRAEGDLFLDDLTLEQVRNALSSPLEIVNSDGASVFASLAQIAQS